MAYQVTLTPRARRDIANAWRFISRDNREAADAFRDKLLAKAHSLKTLALRGPKVKGYPDVRKLTVGNYSIFYKFLKATGEVFILRFWHNVQDPQSFRTKESPSPYSTAPVTQPSP